MHFTALSNSQARVGTQDEYAQIEQRVKDKMETHKDAIISECGKYRYLLQRSWGVNRKALCFVMLNPSTADANEDDPTTRRCLGFAQDLGFGQLEVVNLFAWRATDKRELKRVGDPIGLENDYQISQAVSVCHMVICAWGATFRYRYDPRPAQVLGIIRRCGKRPLALRVGKTGHPYHPLYLPRVCNLVELL